MKIKYDMSKNYWNAHNEAQAIVMMRKKLLRNKNAKIGNVFQSGIFYGIGILIVSVFYFVCKKIGGEEIFLNIISDLLLFLLVFLVLYFIIIFATYFINYKSSTHKGILKIDEKGLTDKDENGKVTPMPWENILLVGVGKYTVTFVTNTKKVIFVNIEHKKDIFNALQTYQSKLLVIDKSKEK